MKKMVMAVTVLAVAWATSATAQTTNKYLEYEPSWLGDADLGHTWADSRWAPAFEQYDTNVAAVMEFLNTPRPYRHLYIKEVVVDGVTNKTVLKTRDMKSYLNNLKGVPDDIFPGERPKFPYLPLAAMNSSNKDNPMTPLQIVAFCYDDMDTFGMTDSEVGRFFGACGSKHQVRWATWLVNKLEDKYRYSVPYHVGYYKGTGLEPDAMEDLLDLIELYARRAIRERGESFVTVDGVNPVETEMQPVVDALNAPLFQGLEQAVGNLTGETYTRDRFVSQEEMQTLNELFQAVDTGFRIPDAKDARKIRFLLGTEAFNAWVAEYNGRD